MLNLIIIIVGLPLVVTQMINVTLAMSREVRNPTPPTNAMANPRTVSIFSNMFFAAVLLVGWSMAVLSKHHELYG
ncbi:hypothetical protein YALI2_D00448g [Yarrowia lipolytica]|jgi:hypothetical protein|nr:hypothetical protein YALI2_D00448g [Yarrowia lipolytica]